MNPEELKQDAIDAVEQHGIVFIDEIHKICKRGDFPVPDVSREGVQRDLLPLVEVAPFPPNTGWSKLTTFCLSLLARSRLRNRLT